MTELGKTKRFGSDGAMLWPPGGFPKQRPDGPSVLSVLFGLVCLCGLVMWSVVLPVIGALWIMGVLK